MPFDRWGVDDSVPLPAPPPPPADYAQKHIQLAEEMRLVASFEPSPLLKSAFEAYARETAKLQDVRKSVVVRAPPLRPRLLLLL